MPLEANVVQFVRLLRRAGMALGPGDSIDAERAVAAVDMVRKDQFYAALHATLVRTRADHDLFDEAFRLFWRDPMGMDSALSLLLPQLKMPTNRGVSRRLSEAWHPPKPQDQQPPRMEEQVDTFLAYSADEVLRTRDFDQMSADELVQARRIVKLMDAKIALVKTRRTRPAEHGGRVDRMRTVRAALRRGGEVAELKWKRPIEKPPTVVALCDISGSMGRYSEMLLRFLHTLLAHRKRGHVFTFATHLTNVTRTLKDRDVDRALALVGREVTDWASGTRLGECLREFNRHWSRRVLTQGAIVLLVTDGLDRDDASVLKAEAARLGRSCKKLIWLNPLLRYAGFEPKASGVRALMPAVDEHRPIHDLASLEQLASVLAGA
ncbi:MAG: VWA domain-containing protein [Kofleriaceae bacterium]